MKIADVPGVAILDMQMSKVPIISGYDLRSVSEEKKLKINQAETRITCAGHVY
jgi:hypothetical protein